MSMTSAQLGMHKDALPELVLYECHCIGFPPGPDGFALILRICDSDDGSCTVQYRNMDGKKSQPCPRGDVVRLFRDFSKLIDQGYLYADLSHAIRTCLREDLSVKP